MSAFQPYAGVYEFHGQSFNWRCYATSRLHEVRRKDHEPLPPPPAGRKWIAPADASHDPGIVLLVDEDVSDISQILLQIGPPSGRSA